MKDIKEAKVLYIHQSREDFLSCSAWYRESTVSACVTRREGFAEKLIRLSVYLKTHVRGKQCISVILFNRILTAISSYSSNTPRNELYSER